MAKGGPPRPGTPKPEMGGAALYSYALVDALLSCRYAAMETDDTQPFHAGCNWFLTLSAPTTGYYTDEWEKWQLKELADGPEDEEGELVLSKEDRLKEIARALKMLQDAGILWFKKGRYTGDAKQLKGFYSSKEPDEEEAQIAAEAVQDLDDAGEDNED